MNQLLRNNFQKAIAKAGLSEKDRKDLDELISAVPGPDEREGIIKLLVERPKLISKLIENFQKKKEIIASQDKEAWQKLLEEEKGELEKLVE
ncbi:hypothetical protein COY65_00290 [Candidatus Jorgensenbacteria bacterium CG_4_10_14_0_8_um_filter_39_13]|uniref:Uncharacterized protein n=2 Tax=Candidatus Joergenseniibacteriota TaxID=1752739 RepID=A0A2M7RIG4_9BACT|nr:MAG: hypothetical protein COV54_01105 [Candidatus Jorgensenbacteria bacterium CG11_big_fil_rev_8_21_14_0_20_38_23]PIV13244.1 MAG: hypothetical protein COS46_01265 [Candidatus Jorgensenbacteria bacterium CG03_land_8_20_14_0_80_38_39]PIY96548.1 MAG: hypothetical protein COY65_00290 [Candidatus Jorgensenbacteria bacterium CG_4_10_14_0_8_um_filter_39_13]PJA95154.1 MAG: hypothetical protein CO130_00660 [Candidatus Jorgensenbacteria bacterium CG_4_9_14_3_um_filter_38_10]